MYAVNQTYGSYWDPRTWFVTERDAAIEVLRRRQERKEPIASGTTMTEGGSQAFLAEVRTLWNDEWGKDAPLSVRVVIETLKDYQILLVVPGLPPPDKPLPSAILKYGAVAVGAVLVLYVLGGLKGIK